MSKKFGLLGEHLSHSHSPLIQKHLFEIKNVEATYELIECSKDELPQILMKLISGEYQGFNVTIPYKEEVMQYLDYINPKSLEIGSVNTIAYENGFLVGYNTDYYGFLEEIKFYNIDILKKECYILGTGGASKAVAKALTDLGGIIRKVSRTKNEEKKILNYADLEDISNLDVLVNTTPVGMFPNVEGCPISDSIINKTKIVIDIIFNPNVTKLMSKSKKAYNGLFMLISQAHHAQNIWFNEKTTVDYNQILQYVEGVIYSE